MNRGLKHMMQQMQMGKASLSQSEDEGTDNKSARAHKETSRRTEMIAERHHARGEGLPQSCGGSFK